jgi:hypothetical protein
MGLCGGYRIVAMDLCSGLCFRNDEPLSSEFSDEADMAPMRQKGCEKVDEGAEVP